MKFTLNQIIREKKFELKELQLKVQSKIFQQQNVQLNISLHRAYIFAQSGKDYNWRSGVQYK